MSTLLPKWNPATPGNNDNLDLTDEEKAQNKKARDENEPIKFDPNVTEKGPISKGFRIFTDPNAKMHQQPWRQRSRVQDENNENITVYTDGSCENNGQEDARAGAGIWYGPDDERNKALRVPKNMPQTNQTAELLAVYHVVQATPPGAQLHIKTDSRYV